MNKRINKYYCIECEYIIITEDIEKGTTPFVIGCPRCKGNMRSHFYTGVYPDIRVDCTWKKPTKKEYDKLHILEKDHVDMGGLCLYPIREKFLKIENRCCEIKLKKE